MVSQRPGNGFGNADRCRQVKNNLHTLNRALGPVEGANKNGALSDLLKVGADNLRGNGEKLNATLTGLGDSSFLDTADGDVLRFKNNGYASLPQGLVTASDNDFTVEMTMTSATPTNSMSWVIGDGLGTYNSAALGNYVFMNGDSAQSGYTGQILAAIRQKVDSTNGETRMQAPASNGGLDTGTFTTVTMVSSGNTLTLYKNGVQISTLTHSDSLSDIIPSGDVLGYLGRSLYTPDDKLTADVSGVKFWDTALTATQVDESMPTAATKTALTKDLVQTDLSGLSILGGNASATQVTANLSLPATVDAS